VEPEDLLPCWQEPTTGRSTELHQMYDPEIIIRNRFSKIIFKAFLNRIQVEIELHEMYILHS
jgi:hypothetical protein